MSNASRQLYCFTESLFVRKMTCCKCVWNGEHFERFFHSLIACRFSMPKFRWSELKYDIVKAEEVVFSRSSTRLQRRLGCEGAEIKMKGHILVFVAGLGCSTP